MSKRRKKPKDDITIRGWIIDGKLIPDEEFDYKKHVLDPYEKKHGTLEGQPLYELIGRHYKQFVIKWMKQYAKEKEGLI